MRDTWQSEVHRLPSDGCSFSRSEALRDHPIFIGRPRFPRPFRRTWSHHDRWIFIRRTRSRAMGAPCGSRSNLHPTATMKTGFLSLFAEIGSVGFQSDGVGDVWKNTTIAVRSNRDRDAIETRSWSLLHGIYSTTLDRHFLEHLEHDRRPIVAQSRRDRGRSWRKSWPSWRLI